MGDTAATGYLRVAFCIAHTRVTEARREGTRNRTGVKAPLRSHGVLLWPCRVKGTRKLARPSCYVKPNFSLQRDRPLLPPPLPLLTARENDPRKEGRKEEVGLGHAETRLRRAFESRPRLASTWWRATAATVPRSN